MGVSAPASADAPNYDLITRDSAAEARGDQRVLDFEHAGRYRAKVRLWSSAESETEIGLFTYDVLAGTDDLLLFASPGYLAGTRLPFGSANSNNVRVAEFNEVLVLDADAQLTFIFSLATSAGGGAMTQDRLLSFYAEVERLD